MTTKEAVKELWAWQYSNTGCFHNMLFDLIAKADFNSIKLLQMAFPLEVEVYLAWYRAPSPQRFFEANGLTLTEKP